MMLSNTYRSLLIVIAGFFLTTVLHGEAVAQTNSPRGARNIVLVHGAFSDGSGWSKVIALLQARGFHVVAAQIPLTSLAADVAATRRAIALQDGPVLLVGHSYGGAVITEAGNDPKVVGLVYAAAFALSDGESVASASKPFPPTPVGGELRPDAEGFVKVTAKGVAEDLAQDLTAREKQILTATQGPTAAAVFAATITTAAWRTKPSWYVIASNDRTVSPELQKAEAAAIKAVSITLPSGHFVMLSHPREVADLIGQAAERGGAPAQVQAAPPIPGVIGKVAAITGTSLDIQTSSGTVHIEVEQSLTTYRQVPSDLRHITPNSYIGVVSVKQTNGTEAAQMITIFPPELRGAAEGSVLMDGAPGATTRNRMTNGSVSRTVSDSRMTNGTAQKDDNNNTLVVHYQDGAQTISVPPNVAVTEIAAATVAFAPGDTIYAATIEQPNGTVTTNKLLLIAAAASRN